MDSTPFAPFVDRQSELALLAELAASRRAEFFVLYGRRRVGKTELLRRFCQGVRHVFFVADQAPAVEQLRTFSERLWAAAHGELEAGFTFPSWEAALRYAGKLAERERLVLVMDEFPYLAEADRSLPSRLQRIWDEYLRHTRLMVVLCGSYVSFMERQVLGEKSPLYGRRTGQYHLLPLSFADAAGFFPGMSGVKRVEAYAIVGGIPAYLERFQGCPDVLEAVPRLILRKGSFLYDEPRFLLMEELREPANYFSLLRAIAWGKTRLNEIAQASALPDRAAAARYLDTLRELGFVERVLPVTEEAPHKSRRGLYRLRDPFFRFWFRFVLPHRSELEAGDADAVMEKHVRPHFSEFTAPAFEEVARQHLPALSRQGRLPFRLERVGAWWDGREEIDVVGLGEDGQVLVGECKWWAHPVGINVLHELHRRAAHLQASVPRLAGRPLHHALFSREGFTGELASLARSRPDLHIFAADDL